MILRIADKSHVDGIYELETECFHDPYGKKLIADSIENPMNYVIVMLDNGRVVAYAEFGNFVDTVFLNRVAVTADHRRQGIARTLLSRGEDWTITQGLDYIMLEVRNANFPAIKMYTECGYTEAGVRKGYYKNPPGDALIYSKKI